MEDRALNSKHSTSGMAGRFACKVNPKNLIITHFSQRYTGTNIPITVQNLLKETQKECPNVKVYAANDFWSFEVSDSTSTKKKSS